MESLMQQVACKIEPAAFCMSRLTTFQSVQPSRHIELASAYLREIIEITNNHNAPSSREIRFYAIIYIMNFARAHYGLHSKQ